MQVAGKGPGLVDGLYSAAERAGIEILLRHARLGLVADTRGTHGMRVRAGRSTAELHGSVVFASGGFQANAEWRTRYLGPATRRTS